MKPSVFLDFRNNCPHYFYVRQWFSPSHTCNKASNQSGVCAKRTCPRIAEAYPTFVCEKCQQYGKTCAGTTDEKPCGKWKHIKTGESISEILGLIVGEIK